MSPSNVSIISVFESGSSLGILSQQVYTQHRLFYVVPNTTLTLKCAKNKKVGNKNIVNLFWTKRANKNNIHLYKLRTFEVPQY